MKQFLKGFLSSFIITLGLSLAVSVFAGVGDINLISKIAPYNDGFVGMVDAEQIIAGTFPGTFIFDTNLDIVGTATTSQLCFDDDTCMTTAPAGTAFATTSADYWYSTQSVWATTSEQYFWNTTSTWASYDTNWARNYNATTT